LTFFFQNEILYILNILILLCLRACVNACVRSYVNACVRSYVRTRVRACKYSNYIVTQRSMYYNIFNSYRILSSFISTQLGLHSSPRALLPYGTQHLNPPFINVRIETRVCMYTYCTRERLPVAACERDVCVCLYVPYMYSYSILPKYFFSLSTVRHSKLYPYRARTQTKYVNLNFSFCVHHVEKILSLSCTHADI
jgi:hypothetical protein